jgi:DNA-binding NarL/FixJ family response regulator
LIERVAAHPILSRKPDPRLAELTPREREVFELVGQGLSNAEIAEALTLERTTIKTHVQRILTKLDARDRVEVVILAYEWGLITPGHTPHSAARGPHA